MLVMQYSDNSNSARVLPAMTRLIPGNFILNVPFET